MNALPPHTAGSELISIVVAFYNEEKSIGRFFSEMDNATASLDAQFEYEIGRAHV